MSIVRNAIKCSAANCRWKPIRGGSTERAKGASVTFAAPTSGIMMIDDDKLMIMMMTMMMMVMMKMEAHSMRVHVDCRAGRAHV